MRFLSVEINNFSSYEHLKFNFDNQDLVLISGSTGSGKSTLCDVIPWILFGKTAKNGAVDEVLRWGSDNYTTGTLVLESQGETIVVTRKRGSKDNDLYFTTNITIRGKDLADTQKLLNDKLKLNPDAYLAGSYFHEFSQVASFFTTTAKIRRQITEQLVDLSLAKTLNKNLTYYSKEISKEIIDLTNKMSNKQYSLTQLQDNQKSLAWKKDHFNSNNKQQVADMKYKSDNFEKQKKSDIESLLIDFNKTKLELEEEIVDLKSNMKDYSYFKSARESIEFEIASLGSGLCSECGAAKDSSKRLLLTKKLYEVKTEQSKNEQTQIEIDKLEQLLAKHLSTSGYSLRAIEKEKLKENTFKEQLKQLKKEVNPYSLLIEENELTKVLLEDELSNLELKLSEFKVEASDINLLLEVTDEFRGSVVKNSIIQIETMTNKLLNDHFDAELRVSFDIKEADKLEVSILKDGNMCSYTQLSKGQRQLLKLCFGTSVMKYMNNNIRSNVLFFDEALDGLDDTMKTKAFTLFNVLKLDYESIFVVEHNETLKSMFPKRYEVTLINGSSKIEEA